MALNRQLWIAIASVMVIAFISSLAISFQSARAYFEEQLNLKNIDNANTLALSLSQVEKDPVLIELMIAAQFDTGHYQRIELNDPDGGVIAARTRSADHVDDVPDWFAELAALRVDAGIAQVQDGWKQFGTLHVESLTGFALEALWDTTVELFAWFLGIAVVLGLLGSVVLKSLTRPLDDVVRQAEAIGNQRFITTPEPWTLEFRRVVKAMNVLTGRVRRMLAAERSRLDEMRQRLQRDALTGVGNRNRFNDVLTALLADDDANRQHGLYLIRVVDLADINRDLGHQETDALLRQITTRINAVVERYKEHFTDEHIARLNGSDFAVILTDLLDIDPIAKELEAEMQEIASTQVGDTPIRLALSADTFGPEQDRAAIMVQLDDLLARAEHEQKTCLARSTSENSAVLLHGNDAWRAILRSAIHERTIHTTHFPYQRLEGGLIHREAMVRLKKDGQTWTAGQFLPWARRLGLLAELDLVIFEKELAQLASDSAASPIALNLSIETLLDESTRNRLMSLLATYETLATSVWIEIAEKAVVHHPAAFSEFCEAATPRGYAVGIEQAGHRLMDIETLHELGLAYLKLDRSLTADLTGAESNRNYLRGITGMAHSIGLIVIADGIRSSEDLITVGELGFDGASGPALNP
ncbi:MAG: EAL domain-containing protein [Spiribacter salinus]|uniref:EAL domain-containing protein n=1 Tax=Spiribacter salinus TaxID=1335746 RepID=A0A540VRX0_9GAMM|nr:MAG: EAL domain-containing protein [Spiribacter salinus]